MSILIKGMEMPKKGVYFAVISFDGDSLSIRILPSKKPFFDGRIEEIPTPHSRLIDADKLFCKIDGIKGWDYGDESDMAISAAEALSAIDDSPTVIEAEANK